MVAALHAAPQYKAGVYVIEDKASKAIKVGKATHGKYENRLKQLQTGNPNEMRIIKTYPTQTHEEAFKLETALHNELKHHHKKGEWYIDNDEVRKVLFHNN